VVLVTNGVGGVFGAFSELSQVSWQGLATSLQLDDPERLRRTLGRDRALFAALEKSLPPSAIVGAVLPTTTADVRRLQKLKTLLFPRRIATLDASLVAFCADRGAPLFILSLDEAPSELAGRPLEAIPLASATGRLWRLDPEYSAPGASDSGHPRRNIKGSAEQARE
jgi:hypothetical protein